MGQRGAEGVVQRSNGRYRAFVYIGRINGKRRYSSRTFDTKKEASQWRNKQKADRDSGSFVAPTKFTIADLVEKWGEEYASTQLAPKTWERYDEYFRVHILPGIGGTPLQKLTAPHLQSLCAGVMAKGRSAKTALHVHRLVHRLLNAALKWGLVGRNVADGVEAPRPQRREIQLPSEEELGQLLSVLGPTPYYVPSLLALAGGMRRGEILGLRWTDVDMDAALLHIIQELTQTRQGITFKNVKTSRSRRPIDIPTFLVDALRKHREIQAAERAVFGTDYHDHRLVVCRPNGDPWPPDLFSGSWWKVARTRGFTLRFHDLRHADASLLLKLGVHPKVVQERLGHSTISMTMDTYSHVMPSMQRDAATALDNALRRLNGGNGR